MAMLTIYGNDHSSCAQKVFWCAEELGLPYRRIDKGGSFGGLGDPEYVQLNPNRLIPTIDDDGFVLWESNTIVRYLASKHRRADLYPTEIKPRGNVEQWMDWAATDAYQGIRPVFLGLTVKMAPHKDDAEGIKNGIAEWTRQMVRLEQHLVSSGGHVAGAQFTVADIPVGLILNRWFGIAFDKPELPAVSKYYDRLTERPAYRMHGRNGTP